MDYKNCGLYRGLLFLAVAGASETCRPIERLNFGVGAGRRRSRTGILCVCLALMGTLRVRAGFMLSILKCE